MKRCSWILIAAGLASATTFEIPYAGGKLSGSLMVPVGSSVPSERHAILIGNLEVHLGYGVQQFPAVCGYKPPVVVQFRAPFGSVMQEADKSADWSAFDTYPASGLVALDSTRSYFFPGSDTLIAPGFNVYEAGQNASCGGAEYSMYTGWNRVVFLRFGSGVDYRAKLSFRAVDDTSYVGPPTFTTYNILRGVRLDYVLNANSTDIAAPAIAVRPARPDRGTTRYGAGVAYDLYNPLGVKLKREPGRFEAVVPAARAVSGQ